MFRYWSTKLASYVLKCHAPLSANELYVNKSEFWRNISYSRLGAFMEYGHKKKREGMIFFFFLILGLCAWAWSGLQASSFVFIDLLIFLFFY